MLEYALRYRKRGFSVIPCKKDKTPFIKWQPYQLQKPTEDEIRQWWGKHPDANIGIACGPVSGVDVLDVDTEEAYQNLTEIFLNETFQTPIAKTPKGRHLYFKHRTGLSNAVRVVAGTDLRTQGGYVIAPPSHNGGGVPYYWLEGLTPKDCEFAEWPEDLFATLQQGGRAVDRSIQKTISKDLDESLGLFCEGRRDDDIFHVANILTKGGCEDSYKNEVLKIIARNCSPPYPIEDIESKIKSASDRHSKKHGDVLRAIECYIDEDETGTFSIRDCYENILNRGGGIIERETIRKTLARFAKEKSKIVADSTRRGWYRKVLLAREEIDFANSTSEYLKLYLPFHLEEEVRISPANIIVI
ncbi:MAG: bifunctional DNA primase/polymerase, partial [Syntrophales bacterium LBB04]|nr:bifunctional DNA primase/polymerase [Syntrophales bacterium LBB04]